MDLWNAIAGIPGIGPVLPYLAALGLICAALATGLPAPATASGWYYFAYKMINFAGLNLGHAKTAEAVALERKVASLNNKGNNVT